MIGGLLFAFVAGAVATANPCGFALLPAFIARRLAAEDGGSVPILRALAVGGVTTVGFVLLFGIVGGAVSAGLSGLGAILPPVGLAIGVTLVLVGIATFMGRRVALPFPGFLSGGPTTGFRGDFMFGLGFGAASLGCTLPVFLAVAGTAMTDSIGLGVLSFAAYAIGMGTVLSALAVAAALTRTGMSQAIRRIVPYMSRISGAILVAAGLYVTFYWLSALGLVPSTLIIVGDGLAAKVRALITNPVTLAVMLFALAAMAAWAVVRARGGSIQTAPETADARPITISED